MVRFLLVFSNTLFWSNVLLILGITLNRKKDLYFKEVICFLKISYVVFQEKVQLSF